MSQSYLDEQIREALAKADGDVVQAQKTLFEAAQNDAFLLKAFVGEHLTAIIASHMQRVIKEATTQKSAQKSIKTNVKNLVKSPKGKAKTEDDFGIELLRAVATGGGTEFGFETMGPSKPRKTPKIKATDSHVETVTNMSKKTKDKK